MESGILIIDKPKGLTSRDVVNQVSKKLKIKHIGHTGTLDPIATGVLVLGVNEGCKVIELLTSAEKEYIAEVIVGLETDTLDSTGKVLHSYNIETLDTQKIEVVLKQFIGKYYQEVPKYSAIHVNGKRLYEYARNHIEVELPKREVEIKEIELLGNVQKVEENFIFSFRVVVSKGTYIRSLIRDIGNSLGIPCTMNALKRTRQGSFSLENSILLEEVDTSKLIEIPKALVEYPQVIVDNPLLDAKIKNGAILDYSMDSPYTLFLDHHEKLLAIYQPYHKDITKSKPYKVFGGNGNEKVK